MLAQSLSQKKTDLSIHVTRDSRKRGQVGSMSCTLVATSSRLEALRHKSCTTTQCCQLQSHSSWGGALPYNSLPHTNHWLITLARLPQSIRAWRTGVGVGGMLTRLWQLFSGRVNLYLGHMSAMPCKSNSAMERQYKMYSSWGQTITAFAVNPPLNIVSLFYQVFAVLFFWEKKDKQYIFWCSFFDFNVQLDHHTPGICTVKATSDTL